MKSNLINKSVITRFGIGVKANFMRGLMQDDPDLRLYEQIATIVQSTTGKEEYPWLDEFPTMRKWTGDRKIKKLGAHKYELVNEDYEATIKVSRNDILDDNVGLFAQRAQSQGNAAAQLPNRLVFDVLKSGFTAAGYDGVPFFGTHEEGGASVSNLEAGTDSIATPWFLLDTRKPLKPLIFQDRQAPEFTSLDDLNDQSVFMRNEFLYGVHRRCVAGFGLWQLAHGSKNALDDDAFDAAFAEMMSRENDEGQKLGVRPSHLVVGPSRRAQANAVIEKMQRTGGESNPNYKAVTVVVTPWLD